jgi:thiamine-phosphate pyrophosphorylase
MNLTTSNSPIRGLYAITPECASTAELIRKVAAALAGGVKVIQYRQKNQFADVQVLQAHELSKLCSAQNALLIINDNIELAIMVDAAGVHLGRNDMGLIAARGLLGKQKIIGISCYDQMQLAETAASAGADYIAFGAFFWSAVKPAAVRADHAMIHAAKKKFNLPIVAIGGISLQNAPTLLSAGADAVAVISDLFNAPDITAKAFAFQQLFAFQQPLAGKT